MTIFALVREQISITLVESLVGQVELQPVVKCMGKK